MAQDVNLVKLNGSEYIWNGNFWYDVKTFMIPSTIISCNLTKELNKKLGIKPNIIIKNSTN
ncbi:MAG: hypothetical protein ACOX3T_04750 [Bdellovibrionota bacterium]